MLMLVLVLVLVLSVGTRRARRSTPAVLPRAGMSSTGASGTRTFGVAEDVAANGAVAVSERKLGTVDSLLGSQAADRRPSV